MDQDELFLLIVFLIALGVALILSPVIDSLLLRKKRLWLSFLLGALSAFLSAPILKALDLYPQEMSPLARGLLPMMFGIVLGMFAAAYALISIIITLLALEKAGRTGSLKIPRSRPWIAMGLSIPLLVGLNLLMLWTGLMPHGPFDFWGKLLVSLNILQLIVNNRWIIPAFIVAVFLCDLAALYFSYRKNQTGGSPEIETPH